MTCDMCKRDDNRPHYHRFVNMGTKDRPKQKHLWVCADCRGEAVEEHQDDG